MKDKIAIYFSREKWILLTDAIADVACWHYGFDAARPDNVGPPQLNELKGLSQETKNVIYWGKNPG